MPYYVCRMRREDIAQVNELDREAFPTQWPPPNYQHELQNQLARYIVVCDGSKAVEEPEVKASSEEDASGLVSRVRRWLNHDCFFSNKPSPASRQYIVGFAGIWVLADEAHLTNIAVRKRYQHQGIGELLLIAIIELTKEMKADFITLEVRASNTTAQSLYQKYGFTQVGLRRAYYTDNREDGILMSTEKITSAPFQEHFQQLKQAHSSNCGIADNPVTKNKGERISAR